MERENHWLVGADSQAVCKMGFRGSSDSVQRRKACKPLKVVLNAILRDCSRPKQVAIEAYTDGIFILWNGKPFFVGICNGISVDNVDMCR